MYGTRPKIPPYGKPLSDLQKCGLRLSCPIFLIIGATAWQYGKRLRMSFPVETLILPPWEEPRNYFWPIKDSHVFICEAGFSYTDYVDYTASALFRDGAARVDFFSPETHELTYYEKESNDE